MWPDLLIPAWSGLVRKVWWRDATTLYIFRIEPWSLTPALIASRRSTRVYRFRLEAYIAGSGFSGVYCPGTILTR